MTALTIAATWIIAGVAGWILGRRGEAALADTWQQTAIDGMDRITAADAEAAAMRTELRDMRERLAAWDDLTRASDGVYGWHDGQTATWTDLGLTGDCQGQDNIRGQGGRG